MFGVRCRMGCVSSDATRTSYAGGLGASWNPIPGASGEDTTFCPTRIPHRERRRLRRAVRGHTTDPGRTNKRKHCPPAEQIRCREQGRERRKSVSCPNERPTVAGHSLERKISAPVSRDLRHNTEIISWTALLHSAEEIGDYSRRLRLGQIRWRGRGTRGTRQRVSVLHSTFSGQAGQRIPCESRPDSRHASPRLP